MCRSFYANVLSPKAFGVPASGHTSTVSQLKACPVSSCHSGLIRVNKFRNTGTIYKNSAKSIFSELRLQRYKRLLLLSNVIEFPVYVMIKQC